MKFPAHPYPALRISRDSDSLTDYAHLLKSAEATMGFEAVVG